MLQKFRSATAQAKNNTSAVSGALEVRLNRYTPDFDRKTVEAALKPAAT